MQFHDKSFFHRKSQFFDDFLLILLFSLNNKQKTLNIATIYFFLKKIINDVFFNVFGVLTAFKTKPAFTHVIYAISIKKKILPKKCLFQGFFHIFICWWKKTKKIHSLSQQYFFSLKLHKLPIFVLLSLYYDNIFIFL